MFVLKVVVFCLFFKNLGAAPNPPAGESRLRNPFSLELADIQNNLLGLGWADFPAETEKQWKKEGRQGGERKEGT